VTETPEAQTGGAGNALRTVAAIAAVALLFLLGSLVSRALYPDRTPVVIELGGETMGTTWSARVVVPDGARALAAAARDSIEHALDRVNRSMSNWDPDSEVSRFNRADSTEPFGVSPDFAEVVRRAEAVSRRTGGAFDITVAPLVTAWGFGAEGTPGHVADSGAVATALAHVGYERLHVVDGGSALIKDDGRLTLDLSAIAKGFGVDRAAEGLNAIGLAAWAVEVGGEVRARGRKPDGSSWRVGIEAPDPEARRIHRSVTLNDGAIATSGDYRNWYDSGGRRYAHIVDPRNGRPVRWIGFSVTVAHPSATIADAWATGLSVLGPDAGLEIAEREGLAVLYLTTDSAGTYEERGSARWREFESSGEASGNASVAAREAMARTIGMTAAGISWVQNGSPSRKIEASTNTTRM
jgi:thiamine biosynthesis lipoprotein